MAQRCSTVTVGHNRPWGHLNGRRVHGKSPVRPVRYLAPAILKLPDCLSPGYADDGRVSGRRATIDGSQKPSDGTSTGWRILSTSAILCGRRLC